MKNLVFILTIILMSFPMFAQTENYKTAIDNFQKHYNAEKYEDIFNAFSSEMKQALSLEDTK